jgi:hypothetical protein
LEYLAVLADAVQLEEWLVIVKRAVEDAKQGDSRARRWLGDYLLGGKPELLTTLAATEQAGTLDEEIQAQAAGLRASVSRKKILNRVPRSAVPDTAVPETNHGVATSDDPGHGCHPTNGRHNVGRGPLDLKSD